MADLSSLTTNYFATPKEGFTTTTASTVASGATSVPLNSIVGYTNGAIATLVIEPTSATAKQVFTGVVDTAGIQITSVVWTEGTNQTHNAGSTVVDYTTATHMAATTKGLIVSHNQDGSLIGSAVRTALNQTAATGAGWTTLGYTPNTVVDNGNRSYTCTINGIDATGTLSPGMRIQATRTVTAPTKSTSLNGTTQYYSKSSPAGMTFTDDFVVSAWVKLSSYAGTAIASRYDGNNGWQLQLNSSGQIKLSGYNGGTGVNYSEVTSYQSIPLNKWVHVAAQLDMSTFTATTTTSYVMIDGVDVPASVARGGTNPTTLVQAGSINIGALNGANFFPGKIAQAAVFSAKVTQATIQGYISQGLTGSETSLASAYSFNNVITDLNTTNANNLTANNGAVATNADTPFTQTNGLTGYTVGTTNFGIVTASSFSTNTTLVVQVPEGDTLPTTGGISSISYSTQKVPFAFPAQQDKWKVQYLNTAAISLGTTAATWYGGNVLILNVPIGAWNARYSFQHYSERLGTSDYRVMYATLSTSSSTETDKTWLNTQQQGVFSGNSVSSMAHIMQGYINTTSATNYYGLVQEGQPMTSQSVSSCTITAECAYL